MSNCVKYKESSFSVGDTIAISYKIKEGDKERQQLFTGILIKIHGASEADRMITVRKLSRSGIGIERIIPVSSPYIGSIELKRKGTYTKSKLYFIRKLTESKIRHKLYKKR